MLRTLTHFLAALGGSTVLVLVLLSVQPSHLRNAPVEQALEDSAQTPLAAYRRAAELDDAAALERRLESLLAAPSSGLRDAEIDATVARLAGIDLGRAMGLLTDSHSSASRLAAGAWAALEPDAALSALPSVSSAHARAVAAVSMLDVLGHGAEGIERIASALPEQERAHFRADAYSIRAQVDPDSAVTQLLRSRPRSEWDFTVKRIATAWSRRDPSGAIAHAGVLPDEVRDSFIHGVTTEWALTDPEGFLDYAGDRGRIDDLGPALFHASIVLPERVLAIAADHPPVRVEAERTLEEVALFTIAERDPVAALESLDALPPGERRLRARGAVAEAWARTAPEAALSWAEGLRPPAPGVVATVIGHTAATDVGTALNLLEFFHPPADHPAVLMGVATPAAIARTIAGHLASTSQRTQVANRLLQRRTPHSLTALGELTKLWTEIDPEAAMDWIVHAATDFPPALLSDVASEVAASDAEAAAAYIDRLPSDVQRLWAMQLVPHLARRDAVEAVRWIEQFQGQFEYENLFQAAIRSAAASDPESVAAILANPPPSIRQQSDGAALRSMMSGFAGTWVRTDPSSAAAWAEGITDPAAREAAIAVIASAWLNRDSERAQLWALGVRSNETREQVMRAMIGQAIAFGVEVESSFVRSFATDADRQRWISNMVLSVAEGAGGDPRQAQSLITDWIIDPDIHREAAQRIETAMERYSLALRD